MTWIVSFHVSCHAGLEPVTRIRRADTDYQSGGYFTISWARARSRIDVDSMSWLSRDGQGRDRGFQARRSFGRDLRFLKIQRLQIREP